MLLPAAVRGPPNIDTTNSRARKMPPHTSRLFIQGLPPLLSGSRLSLMKQVYLSPANVGAGG